MNNKSELPYAFVGRCQSVTIGGKLYYCGDIVPKVKWALDEGGTFNQIWDAEIIAVSGIRENNIQFYGKDDYGFAVEVSIDASDLIA